MKTIKTEVQAPHIDFRWKALEPSSDRRTDASIDNFNKWIPFIAFFPVTEAGMTVEVWHARSDHQVPVSDEHTQGRLVEIPYGKILILRADVVHAGGFATAASGNPRCHLYVYKTPEGALHATHLGNSYHIGEDNQRVQLEEFYKHCEIDENSFVYGE
jgi:hypothetical protein